jgi:isopentenyl-diphosphate Delta-isomerase
MHETINVVDTFGNRIGTIGKLDAHVQGVLHEAFSIFIFNKKGEMLIQRRAEGKYHSGGLWTNTCCSHPRHTEPVEAAIHRRLKEEMGFDCDMKKMFSFVYRVKLDNGLTEYEFDHVYAGVIEGEMLQPNPEEVCDYAWTTIPELQANVKNCPEKYTEWFKIILASKEFEKLQLLH